MKDISLYENIPSLENNFTVKFRIYENRSSALIPHWHEHIELMYLFEGECDFFCGGRSYPVSEGDLLIINSAEIHSFEVKRNLSFFSILLFPSFFEDIDFNNVVLSNTVSSDKYVRECISDMRNEYESEEKMSDMMLKSHAYRLVAYLARNYRAEDADKLTSLADNARLHRLNNVLEHISTCYHERISTNQLAAMCYLSEAHFCRFFKSDVGKPCTEYINQYRVEKAAVLLTNTEDSVSKIAESVGFDDVNYFSRTFKKFKGVTPSNFRKQT